MFVFKEKFCSKYINGFANHMCLIKTSEVEKKKPLKAVYNNRTLYIVTMFVRKYLDWFKSKKKL